MPELFTTGPRRQVGLFFNCQKIRTARVRTEKMDSSDLVFLVFSIDIILYQASLSFTRLNVTSCGNNIIVIFKENKILSPIE